MIHFTKEGGFKKLGLNLYRARGGFVAAWVWYDVPKHEMKQWRFRLRLHMAPRILWSVETANVIDNFLLVNDLGLLHRETLVDLKAVEESQMRRNDSCAYIKP